MSALILFHRSLGVVFCLFFAMWFASGIVMHFVPFPAPSEAERFAGLAPIGIADVRHTPAEAVAAAGVDSVSRIRLIERSDGPVYIVAAASRITALHAADLSPAAVRSADLALAIAKNYAAHRYWDVSAASVAGVARHDQWTVSGNHDRYRPLYRIALNDDAGRELYVASPTGEVVLTTDRRQRTWNYAGSIAHWIYPTALRAHPAIWTPLLWSISFLALLGATAGAVIGISEVKQSPHRGLQKLHHWLGLACGVFILSFIFSGWLSMDEGFLFSTGKPNAAERLAFAGTPSWDASDAGAIVSPGDKEVEWFSFGGKMYRRERGDFKAQRLSPADAPDAASSAFLTATVVDAAAARLNRPCAPAAIVATEDPYAETAPLPGTPVFRVVCGQDWFDIDASDGVLLDKLDASRRAYRWLFGGLHRLDFPVLAARPALRGALIVALCGLGFLFSLTAVVIAWRRLTRTVPRNN